MRRCCDVLQTVAAAGVDDAMRQPRSDSGRGRLQDSGTGTEPAVTTRTRLTFRCSPACTIVCHAALSVVLQSLVNSSHIFSLAVIFRSSLKLFIALQEASRQRYDLHTIRQLLHYR
jgi:hypothetical protein